MKKAIIMLVVQGILSRA